MTRADAPARLTLPPPFSQWRLATGDIRDEAVRLAPEAGAGALVWRVGGGVAGFAVVLEPETPLGESRMAFFAGMAALADALAAHCPPERAVRVAFPDTVIFDRARLGGARMAQPPGCAEDAVPDWLVFAAELIADRDHLAEPGLFPETTSLKEEGFGPPEAIIESFAAYLMLYFDRWRHQGLDAVTERYLDRIDPPMLTARRVLEGGDMVERAPSGAVRRTSLAQALAACAWRDAQGPRL